VSNQRSEVHTSNVRRVHASAFRYPNGYSYRRWSAGSILPSLFLSSYYFYNDWSAVGAYPPPPGYIWVRYGPDLLLVSRRSGRIRDVIYGVFY
jgi:Ni/Co efflux regulator RcnB